MALDRVNHPDCGPNRLIQVVSAVEGLARALLISSRAAAGEPIELAYERFRRRNTSTLVALWLGIVLRRRPELVFGSEVWGLFGHAVRYRNFLIHECAFLRASYTERLIGAATEVFNELARSAGYTR